MSDSTEQAVLFPDLTKKPVHAIFDEPAATSDGGALLLGALDRSLDASENAFSGFTDSIDRSNRLNNQLITGAIDKTLAIAVKQTPTQSENVMAGVQKIALGLGAVVAVGFIANAIAKRK